MQHQLFVVGPMGHNHMMLSVLNYQCDIAYAFGVKVSMARLPIHATHYLAGIQNGGHILVCLVNAYSTGSRQDDSNTIVRATFVRSS